MSLPTKSIESDKKYACFMVPSAIVKFGRINVFDLPSSQNTPLAISTAMTVDFKALILFIKLFSSSDNGRFNPVPKKESINI